MASQVVSPKIAGTREELVPALLAFVEPLAARDRETRLLCLMFEVKSSLCAAHVGAKESYVFLRALVLCSYLTKPRLDRPMLEPEAVLDVDKVFDG